MRHLIALAALLLAYSACQTMCAAHGLPDAEARALLAPALAPRDVDVLTILGH